jgi:hypothetical protein
MRRLVELVERGELAADLVPHAMRDYLIPGLDTTDVSAVDRPWRNFGGDDIYTAPMTRAGAGLAFRRHLKCRRSAGAFSPEVFLQVGRPPRGLEQCCPAICRA